MKQANYVRYQAMTAKETADALGMTEANVNYHTYRALEKLKRSPILLLHFIESYLIGRDRLSQNVGNEL